MSETEFWTSEDAYTRELLEDYNINQWEEYRSEILNYKHAEEGIKENKKELYTLLYLLKKQAKFKLPIDEGIIKDITEGVKELVKLNDFRALLLKDEIHKNLKEK